MRRYSMRIVIGIFAGAIASAPLLLTASRPLAGMLVAMFVGAAYSASTDSIKGAYVDNMMTAAALGVPLWILVSVVALPLVFSEAPEWGTEQMRSHFPALVGWVVYGASLGLLTQAMRECSERWIGPEHASAPTAAKDLRQIVILGGGFAGMKTAE